MGLNVATPSERRTSTPKERPKLSIFLQTLGSFQKRCLWVRKKSSCAFSSAANVGVSLSL